MTGRGRPKKYNNPGRTTVYFPEDLMLDIQASCLNFNEKTIQFWRAYLNSDKYGIDELKNKIASTRAALDSMEIKLAEMEKLKESVKQANLEEKVESLIGAWWLRKFVRKSGKPPLGSAFTISARDDRRLKEDLRTGEISKESPVEMFEKYGLEVNAVPQRQMARKELAKELSMELKEATL